MNDITSRVEQIAARASALYSRPTVALEVVRLTSEPQVDARLLKTCIEQDPALTCKILRVVNSSFFGLRLEVADLNQALTLLGIKPLKLLVLGFSLPDELFAEVASEQLQWYWETTLTRAVAARLLSTELWNEPGDEAFIAGLLQDIGILALLREMGAPYAKLLTGVMEQRSDLAALERDSLGFDHVELSAALMSQWNLPQRLIDAVAAPKQLDRLGRLTSAEAQLPQILHLAELFAQLVGQRRIKVLPELLEAGGAYRDLTKGHLMVMVENLQPQVDQLAEVLLLELPKDRNYMQVLNTAHERMSSLAEELAGTLRQHRSEDQAYTELLDEARELTDAMRHFLGGHATSDAVDASARDWSQWHAPHERTQGERTAASVGSEDSIGVVALLRHLSTVLSLCRARRQELSLLLFESHSDDLTSAANEEATSVVRNTLRNVCENLHGAPLEVLSITKTRLGAVLPDCERRDAIAMANDVLARVAELAKSDDAPQAVHTATLSAGIATVAAVPKNFDPWRLVECAERCLNAARLCNTNSVKSIEI